MFCPIIGLNLHRVEADPPDHPARRKEFRYESIRKTVKIHCNQDAQ